jgi:hypothetical protein
MGYGAKRNRDRRSRISLALNPGYGARIAVVARSIPQGAPCQAIRMDR